MGGTGLIGGTGSIGGAGSVGHTRSPSGAGLTRGTVMAGGGGRGAEAPTCGGEETSGAIATPGDEATVMADGATEG